MSTTTELKSGMLVEFKGKDSYFKGRVVSVFTKLNGKSVRCVVEDERGLLLIKNPNAGLVLREEQTNDDR